mgnify:CR=1 FL=1
MSIETIKLTEEEKEIFDELSRAKRICIGSGYETPEASATCVAGVIIAKRLNRIIELLEKGER